jgi:hypothetical protein
VNESLQALLDNPDVWCARAGRLAPAQPSGYPWLDECLPGGGWPLGAVSEIVLERYGLGELRLLLPALRQRVDQGGERGWLFWIAPPFTPYAPALDDAGISLRRILVVRADKVSDSLWAAEQALRSGRCAAVLLWADRVPIPSQRRLQLAAESAACMAVLFRPVRALREHSVAALRLHLSAPGEGGLRVHILKSRGGQPVVLDQPGFPVP